MTEVFIWISAVLFILTSMYLGLLLDRRRTKYWMDFHERRLQKESDDNDARRVHGMGFGRSTTTAGDCDTSEGVRKGDKTTRQEGGGPDDTVREGDDKTGRALGGQALIGIELKHRVAVTKAIVAFELERLERRRADAGIVAQYAEIAKDDPILSKLLNDVEFASIRPLRKILDHLKRKNILKLVKPNEQGHH